MIKIFSLVFGLIFFHNYSMANSLSLYGGTYDYDDDNTSNLVGINYHLENNDFNLIESIKLNPVIGLFVTGKSASMIYSGFETNIGQNRLSLNISFCCWYI